jgi:uncharacterized protein (UPF0276 family)
MTPSPLGLGLGIGWRPALASLVLRRPDLGFVEILAEAHPPRRPLPLALVEAGRRGLPIIPHGVGLSLGGAELPDLHRVRFLAALAERVGAPLVSEHVAFLRSAGVEAGHLLPVARTRNSLEVLIENVNWVVERLPVPLAVEPIASLFDWPEAELSETEFLCELVERTGVFLLLDVANVYANARNRGFDPKAFLEALPLERVAYVHVAGGVERGSLYYDTHAHPVPEAVLELLDGVAERQALPGAMLERDENLPPTPALDAELDAIKAAARPLEVGDLSNWRYLSPHAPSQRRSPPPPAARENLGQSQAALVRALVDGAPCPSGFEPAHLAAAAAVLRSKRAHRALAVG